MGNITGNSAGKEFGDQTVGGIPELSTTQGKPFQGTEPVTRRTNIRFDNLPKASQPVSDSPLKPQQEDVFTPEAESVEITENTKLRAVISGEGRGFIRSDPEKMRDLLRTSFSTGNITNALGEQTDELLARVIDLTAHFGQVEIKTSHYERKVAEKYRAMTAVSGFQITIEGVVDPSELTTQSKIVQSPVGPLVPEPRIDIWFRKKSEEGVGGEYSLHLGRNNTITLSTYGERSEKITLDEAKEYILQNLPTVKENNGQPSLSNGVASLSATGVQTFLNDVRLGRIGQNRDPEVERRNQAKRESYGQEAVLFLPQDYFQARNRDGVLFSFNYPQYLIPEDIIEHASAADRIRRIADELKVEVDEKKVSDIRTLLNGLPAGFDQIGFLYEKEDGSETTDSRRVPTLIFDKAAGYCLTHLDLIEEPIKKSRKMSEEVGKEPQAAYSDTYVVPIIAGLLDKPGDEYRKFFKKLSESSFNGRDMDSITIQNAINQAYDSLVQFGKAMKGEVYSTDDLTLVSHVY